ncbi:Transmembrane protein [Dirofilaria immitis]|nr:Transmembrane protein [Dirofilaria immitis]
MIHKGLGYKVRHGVEVVLQLCLIAIGFVWWYRSIHHDPLDLPCDEFSTINIRSQDKLTRIRNHLMLTVSECIRWTSVTIFEIWLHAIGLLVFSVLVVVKTEVYSALTYWDVFTPLFIVTVLNLYFLFIVLVRAVVEEKQCKDPILKHAFSWLRLVMIGIFEALLCYKVNGDLEDGQRDGYSGILIFVSTVLLQLSKLPNNCTVRSLISTSNIDMSVRISSDITLSDFSFVTKLLRCAKLYSGLQSLQAICVKSFCEQGPISNFLTSKTLEIELVINFFPN